MPRPAVGLWEPGLRYGRASHPYADPGDRLRLTALAESERARPRL